MKFGQAIRGLIAKAANIGQPVTDGWWQRRRSGTGLAVTQGNAMTMSAVYGCVRIISESIAQLPIHIHRLRDDQRGSEIARDMQEDRLISLRPNPVMDASVFWETLIADVLLHGNAYAEIEFDQRGRAAALWPRKPDEIVLYQAEDESDLFYEYSPSKGPRRIIPHYCMLHLMGYSKNGMVGVPVIMLAAEAMALGLAAEEYAARYFGEGTNLGGFMETPGKLSQSAYDRLRHDMDEKYKGLRRSHGVIILEEGLKYNPLAVDPEAAQLLQTRKFQTEEIARFFRVPLHMLQDLDRATFNNIEHMAIEFVTHCLMPWIKKIERAVNLKVLCGDPKFFCKVNVDALVRGDIKSRYDAYAIGRQWGWLSVNDIREREDMNLIENGDQYLTPLNMMLADKMDAYVASLINGQEPDDEEPERDF